MRRDCSGSTQRRQTPFARALANAPVLRDNRRVLVFLNGRFVPEEQAVVSAFDRGFLYGDGLFETLRVMNGVPLDWGGHWRRLASGAETLKLKLPFASDYLRAQARELSQQNQLPEAILRLTLSRGVGPRGYPPKGADTPTLAMSLHPAPELGAIAPQWKLHTASLRVPAGDALSACKSANKLLHVLARAEAEVAGADDALLLNACGEVAETTSANIFWVEGGGLQTPSLAAGALPGVTRANVLAWAHTHAVPVHETTVRPERLRHTEGCFLTLSSYGVIEVSALDGQPVPRSPLTQRIRTALLADWRAEAGGS
jgi:aminodeoxychorismate lyase